jgi:uncharacterized damage-inducible protein DinB
VSNISSTHDSTLLDAILDSWDRNNTIVVNLLGALPSEALEVRATSDSPTVAQLFAHIHYVRLVFIQEDAPESARELPADEWAAPTDKRRLAELLNESAAAVRVAVRRRIDEARDMEMHYDHPILFVQHMIWHEGYHHGQIKLALKLAGMPMSDAIASPLSWRVWMNKRDR